MALNSQALAAQQEEQEAKLSVPKVLEPGIRKARIYDLQLENGYKHDENGSLHLLIFLEGEEMGEEFEGFYIDPDDKDKGRHKGQIARVKASNFAFETKTIEIKKGLRKGETMDINRDEEIAKVLINIAKAQGKIGEYVVNGETIEEYLELSKPILCNDTMLTWCLAGRQFQDKKGYDRWDLFLPYDKNRKKFPFSLNPDSVIPFNKTEHMVLAKKSETVDEFAATSDELAVSTGSEFQV